MDYDLPVVLFEDHKNIDYVEFGLFRVTLKHRLEYIASGGPNAIREALSNETISGECYTIIPLFSVK